MIREDIGEMIEHHVQGMRGNPYLPSYQGKLALAMKILSLITTEIEKVGNPYMPIRSGTSDADRNSTFESCRNKILNLLKEQI